MIKSKIQMAKLTDSKFLISNIQKTIFIPYMLYEKAVEAIKYIRNIQPGKFFLAFSLKRPGR